MALNYFSLKKLQFNISALFIFVFLLINPSAFAVQELSQENFYDLVTDGLNGDYKLIENINISTVNNGLPPTGPTVFGDFTGTFNGDGKIISGLTTPLFDTLTSTGSVLNLSLETSGTLFGKGILANNSVYGSVVDSVNVSGDVDGGSESSVGGLIGNSNSIIRNSNMSGSVESSGDSVGGLVGYSNNLIENSSTTNVTVTGRQYVGGLVGYTAPSGSILDSHSEVGEVNGGNSVGGLVGLAFGPITDSFAKELEINETLISGPDCAYSCFGGLVGIIGDGTADISNSYSRVNVNAPSGNFVGGLVGGISSADIEISKTYSIGETTGQDYVGGLIGGTLYDSLSPIISDSHAQVNVVGRRYVGGFIGYFYDSYISNSYASSVVSGNEPDRSGAFAGSANSISGSFLTRVSASGSAPVENDEEATRDALFGERSGLIQYTGPIEYYQGTIDSTDLFASLGLNWSLNPAINDALPYITSLECSYRECDSDSPPSNGIAYTNRIILSKEREVAISDAKNFIAYNHEISKDCCFSIIDSRTTNVSNLTSTYISENQIATGIPLDLYLNMGEKLQVKVETDPRVYLNLWMESDYCEPVYLGEVPANNLLSTEKQIVILPPFEFSKSGDYTLSLYKSKIDNTVKVDNMNLYTQIHILVQ